MFPKEYRFKSRLGDEFFANAKRVYSPLFVLYYQKRDDLQSNVTVVVPKKHVSKATQRNKIKRKMRNGLIPYLDKLEGINVVLYLKRKLAEDSFKDFDKEVNMLINKITV